MIFKLKSLGVLVILCFVFSTFADMALGKMAPPSWFEVKDLITKLDQLKQRRNLSKDETSTLFLLKFVSEVLDVDKFSAYIRGSVKANHIVNELDKHIFYKGTWSKNLTTEQIARINNDKKLLSTIIDEKSIIWAWVQKTAGDSNKSKKIIEDLFENQFNETMALKEAHYGFHGPGPMGHSVKYVEFLDTLSSEKEKVDRLFSVRSGKP